MLAFLIVIKILAANRCRAMVLCAPNRPRTIARSGIGDSWFMLRLWGIDDPELRRLKSATVWNRLVGSAIFRGCSNDGSRVAYLGLDGTFARSLITLERLAENG